MTTLPPASSTLTTGWAPKATPLVELPGDGGEDQLGGRPVVDGDVRRGRRGQAGAGRREGVAAGDAGDSAAGEGGHACGGGQRVGGAGQRARGGGHRQGDRAEAEVDHVAARVLDLDHGLGAEGDTVVRGARGSVVMTSWSGPR